MRYSILLMLCMGLFFAGCPDKKPKFPNCGKDKDCKEGQYCFQKTCSECSTDEHCEDWETCASGACVPKDGMCGTDDDCTGGKICKEHTCSACESDTECGPAGRCSNGACLERDKCNVDEDCMDDEDCIDGICQLSGRSAPPDLSCDLTTIHFSLDEYTIPEEGRSVLQENSACMQQAPDRNVLLSGHTDESGTAEYNIALSEKRARSAADFLSRLGIDPARLRVIPKGETEASATDDAGRADERRVEFEWQ